MSDVPGLSRLVLAMCIYRLLAIPLDHVTEHLMGILDLRHTAPKGV
jgi:hypothetical protein